MPKDGLPSRRMPLSPGPHLDRQGRNCGAGDWNDAPVSHGPPVGGAASQRGEMTHETANGLNSPGRG